VADVPVEVVSSSPSHFELVAIAREVARLRLAIEGFRADSEALLGEVGGIRGILQAMFDNSLALQQQAADCLANQQRHAESYLAHLDEVDYYPFVTLPAGTTARDLPDGGREFGLPDGGIIRTRPDHGLTVIHDGRAMNVNISLAGTVILPDGRQFQVRKDYLRSTHAAAGIEGLPAGIQPTCIGRGRYRVEFPDGVIITVWHALPADGTHPAQECLLSVGNPTGGILVVSRKGIQGIGLTVQMRLLADSALAFRVQPDGNPDAAQYLHAGAARPMQGVVEIALSNGHTIVYRCGRDEDDGSGGDGGTGGGSGGGSGGSGSGTDASDASYKPETFTCEERGQCST